MVNSIPKEPFMLSMHGWRKERNTHVNRSLSCVLVWFLLPLITSFFEILCDIGIFSGMAQIWGLQVVWAFCAEHMQFLGVRMGMTWCALGTSEQNMIEKIWSGDDVARNKWVTWDSEANSCDMWHITVHNSTQVFHCGFWKTMAIPPLHIHIRQTQQLFEQAFQAGSCKPPFYEPWNHVLTSKVRLSSHSPGAWLSIIPQYELRHQFIASS